MNFSVTHNSLNMSYRSPYRDRAVFRKYKSMTKRLFIFSITLIFSICGCTKDDRSEDENRLIQARSIDSEICGACGMVVREQPAPRAQVVHRDGKRVYFCSVGDMIQYTNTPSPHGKVKHIFVERQTVAVQPQIHDTHPHVWQDARTAHYVMGVKRSGIMGPPVLVFSSEDIAKQVAKRLDAQTLKWNQLTDALLLAAEHPNTH
jgi:copper chaperone NosL